MKTVDEVMGETFNPRSHREPRSNEYMDGCEAALQNAIEHKEIECPWNMGTLRADAWLAGYEEGRRIIAGWRSEASDRNDQRKGKCMQEGTCNTREQLHQDLIAASSAIGLIVEQARWSTNELTDLIIRYHAGKSVLELTLADLITLDRHHSLGV